MFSSSNPRARLLAAAATASIALGVLATPAFAARVIGPVAAPQPQVIAFPSRDFVSVAEPGGTTPTTTWTHPASPVQTSTSTAPGLASALGLVDINHVLAPCWSSPLTAPTSNMSPGDTIGVATAGAANQQLSMTVADVTTAQARLAAGSSTKVVVTGSAKDPVSGLQLAPGLVQVRLIAKKAAFSFNGRRDLTAVLGGTKDGVFTYNTPGSATDFTFTATFELLGGRNTTLAMAQANATQAVAAQTRGIVQDNALAPTTMTIFETPIAGDGVVHGTVPGC